MKLTDLNSNQISMLKQQYLIVVNKENVSWHDLAFADEKVSDDDLEEMYGNIEFVENDFYLN